MQTNVQVGAKNGRSAMDEIFTSKDKNRIEVALRFLGEARLSTYRHASDGSDSSVRALYEWNLRLSAAFHEVLMLVEVAIRNVFDENLSTWNLAQSGNSRNQGRIFSRSWIEEPATPLRGMMQHAIAEAKRQAAATAGRRHGSHPTRQTPPTQDDILAQVSFGKWASLMPYDSNGQPKSVKFRLLWDEALANGFTGAPRIDKVAQDVSGRLHRLHHLRNRIAHGENILAVLPGQRLLDAFFLMKYIDPSLAEWLMALNRIRTVSRDRPISWIAVN